jgi:hypothetical protein
MRIKNSIQKSSLFFLFVFFSTLLFAGCQSLMTFTPEQAAVQNILDYNGGGDFALDPNSIRVMQSQKLQDSVIVLVAFQGTQQGSLQQCLFHYEAHQATIGTWVGGNGGGGCSMAGQDRTPLEVGMGKIMGTQPGVLSYTEVDGFVNQEDILTVKVTWQDGETQQVEVVNSTYLAARTGSQEIEKIEGLDASGGVVYTHTPPEPAPGKTP